MNWSSDFNLKDRPYWFFLTVHFNASIVDFFDFGIIYPLLAFSVFLVERRSIRTIVDGLSYAIVLYCSHYRIPYGPYHSRFSNSVTLSNFSDNLNLIWTHQSLNKTFKLQLNFSTSAKISNFVHFRPLLLSSFIPWLIAF